MAECAASRNMHAALTTARLRPGPAKGRANMRAAWDLQRLNANDFTCGGTFEKLAQSCIAVRNRSPQRCAADVRARGVAAPRGKAYGSMPGGAARKRRRSLPRTGTQDEIVADGSNGHAATGCRSTAAQAFSSRLTALRCRRCASRVTVSAASPRSPSPPRGPRSAPSASGPRREAR